MFDHVWVCWIPAECIRCRRGHLNQRREKGHLISVSKENGSPAPIVPKWPLVIIKENVSAGSAIQKCDAAAARLGPESI